MALLKFAKLTANGTAISGYSSVSVMAGIDMSTDTIECYEASWGTSVRVKKGTIQSGHRTQQPLRLVTRLDQSLPLLQQACSENHTINGTIYLFDSAPENGTVRNYFTLTVSGARIVSVSSVEPDTLGEESSQIATVSLEIIANSTLYEDLVGQTLYEDQWNTVV